MGVFSAFKVHRQQNDIANKLHDENGNLKSFSQWKKDVEPILSHYNKNWLQTEYSTAVMRAREAARFKKFERNADIFPNLKWLPSTSIEKRESHVPFYGLVKPIDDPFWKQHYPGNIWNCKCGITNTDEKPASFTPATNYTPAPGLDENPVNGKIFTATHPYFTKAYDGAEEAVRLYEKQLEKELRERAYDTIKEWRNSINPYTGKIIVSDKIFTGKLIILRRSVDDVKEHHGNWRDLLYIPKIENKINDWEYLGAERPKRLHPDTYAFTHYKAKIGKEYKDIILKCHNLYGEILYCIEKINEERINKLEIDLNKLKK